MNISLSFDAVPFPIAMTLTPYFKTRRFMIRDASSVLDCGFIG